MKQSIKPFVFVFAVLCGLSFLALSAYGEGQAWDCPECGKTGNTFEYCGGCGHAAPWMVSWFDISEGALIEKAKSLWEEAKKWDKKTCPQTLDLFPLYPVGLTEQYSNIKKANSVLYNNGTQYIWETNVEGCFPGNCSWGHAYLLYNSNNEWTSKDFDVIANGAVYAIPRGVSVKDVLGFYISRIIQLDDYAVSYQYSNEFSGDYSTLNRFIDVIVDIRDPNGQLIVWCRGVNRETGKEYVGIEIFDYSGGEWHLTYDAQTGKLLDIITYR